LSHSLPKVFVAGDVVAIKDCPSFVSADRHRHSFTHASTNHVADSRPPQVVKHARRLHHDFFYSVNDLGDRIASFIELRLRQPSRFTRRSPGLSRVANGLAGRFDETHIPKCRVRSTIGTRELPNAAG
jgi:hypothetical protein